LATLRTHS